LDRYETRSDFDLIPIQYRLALARLCDLSTPTIKAPEASSGSDVCQPFGSIGFAGSAVSPSGGLGESKHKPEKMHLPIFPRECI
jgi:hypothetical protein